VEIEIMSSSREALWRRYGVGYNGLLSLSWALLRSWWRVVVVRVAVVVGGDKESCLF